MLWMFLDAVWMDLDFDLFLHWTSCGDSHTPPRTRPSGISYMHQYNTIMIKASTCNNLISVHLYVYNDKFFSPPHSFSHILF